MDPRQRRLLQEQQRSKLESQLKQGLNELRNQHRVNLGMDRFTASSEDRAARLAAETVGLVHLEQFQKIKEGRASGAAPREEAPEEAEERRKRVRLQAAKVSFSIDDEEEGEAVPVRIGPDPTTLARQQLAEEEMLAEERRREEEASLKQKAEEETRRKQPVRISCCFYDGTERRFMAEARKGDTIKELLANCQTAYPPLKGSSLSALMLVKENAIVPHELRICDCGLFQFFQDDSKIDVDYSKNCKIVTRAWYDRNKTSLPAKQWTPYSL